MTVPISPNMGRTARSLVSLCVVLICVVNVRAQAVAAPYSDAYSIRNLGTPAGVPGPLGGVTVSKDNTNVLLIGGAANTPSGAVYAVPVTRDPSGHINALLPATGDGPLYAAPQIDGGLAYSPTGSLLFTGYDPC